MNRTSKNSKMIDAPRMKVFQAFLDEVAIECWLAPDGMTGKIHHFDLKVGGGYEMSLFYHDNNAIGKTTSNEDRFKATFIELKPYERITQAIHFESDDKTLTEEMIMEVKLEELAPRSTHVTIIFKNIPEGINPKDNEEGTEQSLKKLASYVTTKRDKC